MIYGLIALILPTFSLGATEILLEPSGGRAIVVDTDVLMKRNSPIIEDPIVEAKKSSDVSEENSEDKYKQRQTTGLDNKVYWKCYFNAVSCF